MPTSNSRGKKSGATAIASVAATMATMPIKTAETPAKIALVRTKAKNAGNRREKHANDCSPKAGSPNNFLITDNHGGWRVKIQPGDDNQSDQNQQSKKMTCCCFHDISPLTYSSVLFINVSVDEYILCLGVRGNNRHATSGKKAVTKCI